MAQDAGVDAALVHYFFGSKDGLFAMELPLRPAEVIGPLLDAGVAGLGERLARRLLGVWDDPQNRGALLAIVHGASAHPGAAAALREFVTREIVGRGSSRRGPAGAAREPRGVAGDGPARGAYIAQVEPLASLDAEEVVPLVAPTLQRYLDGTL